MDDEIAFHSAMIDIYERAKEECSYNATRFFNMVTEKRGLEAAKSCFLQMNFKTDLQHSGNLIDLTSQ